MFGDSKMRHGLILALGTLLSSCVSVGDKPDLGTISQELFVDKEQEADLLQAFHAICLSAGTMPEDWQAAADETGWTQASDEHLKAAGLSGLRKKVLSLPGGGGRFDEEQIILTDSVMRLPTIINLERRYKGVQTLSSVCAAFAKVPFLQSCEALGGMIGKAPDDNRKYAGSDAHFIRWEVRVNGMPGNISCERAPNTPSLPYQGTILRLSINHLERDPGLTANPPVSAVRGR